MAPTRVAAHAAAARSDTVDIRTPSTSPRHVRDLVVAPAVHLHGGPGGEVTAELSAGRIQWVDGLNAYTVRNLVDRLFSWAPEDGGRLIRLGCLFSDAAREGFLGDTFTGAGLPAGDRRSPMQAKADRRAFESIVRMANFCAAFKLDVTCTRAVVAQALHVAERGNYLLVDTVLSAMRNDYEKHTVSATRKGTKTTMAKYAGYIKRFCVWGEESLPTENSLLPLSRHSVVMFLEEEAGRRLVRRGATTPRPRRNGEDAPREDDDDGVNEDDEFSGAEASDTEAPNAGNPGDRPSASKRARHEGAQFSSAHPTRSAGSTANLAAPSMGTTNRRSPGAAEVASFAAMPGVGGVAPNVDSASGRSAPGQSTIRGLPTPASQEPRGPGRLVSHHTVMGALNALAKVANVFNPLWRLSTCQCCKKWSVDEYLSAGSFHAATAIVERRKRDRLMQETSAGSAKALGKRKQAVTDEQRRGVAQALLLRPTTAAEFQRLSRLNAVYTLQFALAARGATARDLAWSDIAVNTFPGMFCAGGKDQPVLCVYISATKTTEGVVRCIGALPHVEAWLCPAGAMADALYALCHRPGGVASAPPGSFTPVFKPNDDQLLAAGVRPIHFREAGTGSGWRQWYCWLFVPAPNGGLLKAMTYRYHNDSLGPLLAAQGVPDWAAKTHILRKGPAQAGKQRGATESDIREQGIWAPGIGGGGYDNTLPNPGMTRALSGRPADCTAPATPRLGVPVPQVLLDLFAPWVDREEQALAEREAADPRAADEALKDFFKLVRWLTPVYFQTWAARLVSASVPPSSYINRHPLLSHPAFKTYCTTMSAALKAAGDVASRTVAEVLPELADSVGRAVQTVATAASAEQHELQQRLSARIDNGVAAVKQHVDVGLERVIATGEATAVGTRNHIDARFERLEAAQRRPWELLSRFMADGVIRDPRALSALREELARAPLPPVTSAAAEALSSATVPLLPAPATPPRQPASSARKFADHRRVLDLQARGKLAGVPIKDGEDEHVPLLCMAQGLTWEQALDEYAVGLDGRVAIRELQEHFGNRWRLRHEGEAKKRHIKLYSERAALYRAFDVEYLRRGSTVGVDGVLSTLKRRYSGVRNSKEVLSRVKKDYPSGGA